MLKVGCTDPLSLHLSKCHIAENQMSRLICIYAYQYERILCQNVVIGARVITLLFSVVLTLYLIETPFNTFANSRPRLSAVVQW